MIRSASLGPWRGRTHTVGVTDVGAGTVSVRLKVTGSSGASSIDGAQRTLCPGTRTVCRRSTGCAKPDASYWVTVKSVMPNCTPGDPSSVPAAVIRSHGVSP